MSACNFLYCMIFNPRARMREGVLCVCVCVCVYVKSHLASGASVRPEIAVTDSAGNGGQKFVGFSLKPLCSRVTAIRAFYGYLEVGHFLSGNTRVSLPSYEQYQRLQRLKRARVCSGFAEMTAFQLHGRRTATANPGCRTQPRIINFFEHAHNASTSSTIH